MATLEEELVKVSRFKGEKYENDRQEYLSELLMAVDSISNDKWEKLSDQAKDWLESAVRAKENNQELPDFADDEELEPAADEGDDEATAEEPEDAATAEEAAEAAAEPEADDAEGDNSDRADASEPEPAQPKAKPKGGKKPAKAQAQAKSQKPAPAKPKDTRDYSKLTGEKDKFGVTIGTKTHDAVMMYEKGTTQKQIKDTLGGRYYNILKDMIKAGHRVERLEGGIWKLHHKDEKKKGK